jgi:hypothetical protein
LIPQGLQDLAIQLIPVAPVAAEAATGSIQAESYGEVMGFAKGSTHPTLAKLEDRFPRTHSGEREFGIEHLLG